jgi:indole-3-glycerol phosphate synthase
MSESAPGFLDAMARSSAARAAAAARLEPAAELERRAREMPAAPPLVLSPEGFDVIAELKLRSPAMGQLRAADEDVDARIQAYARGGAAAVSVLTEPTRFDGSLEHLRTASRVLTPLGIPAMRKDFLVDPYQVHEARAAGAGGVLVILRMLDAPHLEALLDAAAGHGLFVLLEAFDALDLERARQLLAVRCPIAAAPIMVGLNCRDLQTLEVVPGRFAQLAPLLPAGVPSVAESGVASPADALAMRRLGYGLALIGTALMSAEDPTALLRGILGAARRFGTPQPAARPPGVHRG